MYRDVVQAVWFDAWRYQNEPAPVVALLHEMRAQLARGRRVARSTRRTTEVAIRGALLSMEDLTKKIGFQYSKFRQANREWEAENLAATLPSHTLREHLRAAVAQLLPGKRAGEVAPKLVVFIDDVDRCEPEAAYRLLEGLKIYLTLDNCVFVLGMNQKAIEEAIAQRMRAETDDNPTMRAAAYMEKLCQNVWRLPAVRQPGGVLYDLLPKPADPPGVRDWIRRGIEATGQPCLPPNPRRIKGLSNLIGRLSSHFPTREDIVPDGDMTREAQCLLIVACIYQFHHDLHVRWELDPDLYEKIYDRCRGVDLDFPFLDSLILPQQYPDHEDGRTTPTETPESTYPDPTQANIFWIQPLILHLGDRVPLSHFERYLRGTPA